MSRTATPNGGASVVAASGGGMLPVLPPAPPPMTPSLPSAHQPPKPKKTPFHVAQQQQRQQQQQQAMMGMSTTSGSNGNGNGCVPPSSANSQQTQNPLGALAGGSNGILNQQNLQPPLPLPLPPPPPTTPQTVLAQCSTSNSSGSVGTPMVAQPQHQHQQQQSAAALQPRVGPTPFHAQANNHNSGNNSSSGGGSSSGFVVGGSANVVVTAAPFALAEAAAAALRQRSIVELEREEARLRSGVLHEAEQDRRADIAERFADGLRYVSVLQKQQQQSQTILTLQRNSSSLSAPASVAAVPLKSRTQSIGGAPGAQQPAAPPSTVTVYSLATPRAVHAQLHEIMRAATRKGTVLGEVHDAAVTGAPSVAAKPFGCCNSALVEHRTDEFCAAYLRMCTLAEPSELLACMLHATALLSSSNEEGAARSSSSNASVTAAAVAQELLIGNKFGKLRQDMENIQNAVRRSRADDDGSGASVTAAGSSSSSSASNQHQMLQLQSLSISCSRAPLLPASVILAVLREQEALDERATVEAAAAAAVGCSASTASMARRRRQLHDAEGENSYPFTVAAAGLLDAFGRAYQMCLASLSEEKKMLLAAAEREKEAAAAVAAATASTKPAAAQNNNSARSNAVCHNDTAVALLITFRPRHARSVAWLLSGGAGPACCAAACGVLARRSMEEYRTVRSYEMSVMLSEALRALARFPARCSDAAACWPLLQLVFSVTRYVDAIMAVSAGSGVTAAALDHRAVSGFFANIALPLTACRAHARNRLLGAAPSYAVAIAGGFGDDCGGDCAGGGEEDSPCFRDGVTLLLYAVVTARVSARVVGGTTAACTMAQDWHHVQQVCGGSSAPLLYAVKENLCRLLELPESEFFAAIQPR